MMVDTSTDNNADMFETPGQQLRLHREKLELSTQEIAKRIHLDVKIIEAIESDSSEDMPSAIYVRGYLRSYAKIVNADADKIIELYNADSPPPMPEILPEVKPPSQVSSNDKPVKAFTYLLTLGLVMLLLIWYQSNFVVDTNAVNNDSSSKTIINGVDVTYEIINHPESWQSPIIEPESVLEPEIQNDLLKLQEFNEEQTIEISTSEITDENLVPTVGAGPDKIELKISNDSWIEIYDKNNNRLFHDLAQAGNEYKVEGNAPFNVLLGYSNGVKLIFNGKTFDVESHSRNGVARFILPE